MDHLLAAIQDGGAFMPHGMCYLWRPELLWLHVVSDGLVALSYFAIPPVLVYLVVQARRELRAGGPLGLKGLPHEGVVLAFGLFIVACGATHLIAVVTVWKPIYWVSGSAKALTAMASLATAVALPPLVPRALGLVRAARDEALHRRALEEAHGDLRRLNGELQEAQKARSQQFANVSHELRTPLTLILGPSEELLDRPDLDPEAREQVETIRRNAARLLVHVEDLLDAAVGDESEERLRLDDVDAAQLVHGNADHFRALAGGRDISFSVATPESLPARVDAGKFERIVTNLLSNAFKFVADGGRIGVALSRRDEGGASELVLVVDDDGPGVPVQERERIFERFYQVTQGPSRMTGGTGLGLTITRSFARAHGGSVEVGDAPWGGARFTVRIPQDAVSLPDPAPMAALGAAAAPTGGGTPAPPLAPFPDEDAGESGWAEDDPRPRVLAVEDHPDMRLFLQRVLGRSFACATVPGGREALEVLEADLPDLVITDLMMPGMSGEELIRRIRALPGGEDLPVLVVTARADPALPGELLSAGVQDFLNKPVRADELLARARNLVDEREARRALREALGEHGGDLSGLAAEIVDRKRQLEELVRDKEVLLQELHHRVKGNLQTVASLMSLQLRSVADPSAKAALEDSQSRIRAIALLHERLYRGGALGEVDMARYVQSLSRDLARALIGKGRPVTLDVKADPLVLEVERALACGLVTHELVANALEHGAPPDGGPLFVRIELLSRDDEAVLSVEDHGGGLPHDAPEGGLGLNLVRALTRQLKGTLRFDRNGGLRCELRFPISNTKEPTEAP